MKPRKPLRPVRCQVARTHHKVMPYLVHHPKGLWPVGAAEDVEADVNDFVLSAAFDYRIDVVSYRWVVWRGMAGLRRSDGWVRLRRTTLA